MVGLLVGWAGYKLRLDEVCRRRKNLVEGQYVDS